MAQAATSICARLALLGSLIAALALVAVPSAWAEDIVPAASQTTVSQLGADPTVRVAKHRHCASTKVRLSPRYTGGGGLVASYLYVNGSKVAERHSVGAIRISAARLARGINSFELISEFSDGRAASVVGSLRRCGGR